MRPERQPCSRSRVWGRAPGRAASVHMITSRKSCPRPAQRTGVVLLRGWGAGAPAAPPARLPRAGHRQAGAHARRGRGRAPAHRAPQRAAPRTRQLVRRMTSSVSSALALTGCAAAAGRKWRGSRCRVRLYCSGLASPSGRAQPARRHTRLAATATPRLLLHGEVTWGAAWSRTAPHR